MNYGSAIVLIIHLITRKRNIISLVGLLSKVTDDNILKHLLDDVGHTVPVSQFDVVSSIHQALVPLQSFTSQVNDNNSIV